MSKKEKVLHPNEPSLSELRRIRVQLVADGSDKFQDKKLEAIDSQIKRQVDCGDDVSE